MRFPSAALLAAVLLAPVLAGCETVVDVDLPEHEPRLVVNDLFVADSVWRVSVTESRGIATPAFGGFPPVEDATVELLEGRRVIDTLAYTGCGDCATTGPRQRPTYFSAARTQPATDYTLRVSAPGFETAEATGRAPAPVDFDLARVATPEREGDLQLTLADPAGRDDYYALFLYEKTFVDGTLVGTQQQSFESSSPLLRSDLQESIEGGGAETYRRALFSDAAFRGETRRIRLRPRRAYYYTHEGAPERRLFVVLASLSEASYEYQRTAALADDTEENPFAEPVQVHSNVRGGLGIFAGATRVGQPVPDAALDAAR